MRVISVALRVIPVASLGSSGPEPLFLRSHPEQTIPIKMSIAAVVNEGIHVFILFIVFVILSDFSISILSFFHSPFLSLGGEYKGRRMKISILRALISSSYSSFVYEGCVVFFTVVSMA